MDTHSLLKVKDVARILVISQSAAYRLMQTSIPSIRFGRTVRVRPEDLARFIELSSISSSTDDVSSSQMEYFMSGSQNRGMPSTGRGK